MFTWNITLYSTYAANPTQIQMEEYIPSVFDLRKISESESKGEKASGEDYIIITFFILIITCCCLCMIYYRQFQRLRLQSVER